LEIVCDGIVYRVEELSKLHRPVAAMTRARDPAALDVQGGEERRRAVAYVIVRPPFDLAGAHRQQRLRAIERLDLRFFIAAEHQRPIGRIQIQADDVADLLDEQRILRELERLRAMRL